MIGISTEKLCELTGLSQEQVTQILEQEQGIKSTSDLACLSFEDVRAVLPSDTTRLVQRKLSNLACYLARTGCGVVADTTTVQDILAVVNTNAGAVGATTAAAAAGEGTLGVLASVAGGAPPDDDDDDEQQDYGDSPLHQQQCPPRQQPRRRGGGASSRLPPLPPGSGKRIKELTKMTISCSSVDDNDNGDENHNDGKIKQTCNYCGYARTSKQFQSTIWTLHSIGCHQTPMSIRREIASSTRSKQVQALAAELRLYGNPSSSSKKKKHRRHRISRRGKPNAVDVVKEHVSFYPCGEGGGGGKTRGVCNYCGHQKESFQLQVTVWALHLIGNACPQCPIEIKRKIAHETSSSQVVTKAHELGLLSSSTSTNTNNTTNTTTGDQGATYEHEHEQQQQQQQQGPGAGGGTGQDV